MSDKRKIFAIISAITVVLTTVIVFWAVYIQGAGQNVLGEKIVNKVVPSGELEVDFLDVGQGDAILIKAPGGQNILIDGGPNSRVVERLSEVMMLWDKKIDLMVLTHPHDDHVSGLVNVLDRFEVRKILYTGVSHDSPNYLAWLGKIKEKKVPLMIVDRAQTIDLGAGLKLEILYPIESFLNKTVENLNNSSIAIRLVYGASEVLLTGDAELEEERELVESGANLSADILKAGHHGSDTSTGDLLLKAVDPETVVVSVGKDNDFGHPSLRTLRRIGRMGAKVFRTDESGTVKITSDGNSFKVKP